MSCTVKVCLAIALILVTGALAAVVFVGSGVYNIGADDHHTKIVFAIIEQLRDRSIVRPGLYPHPPSLAQESVPDARTAFWIVKHGIKMSAMPAWGKSLDDAAIWDIVAFLCQMPNMSAETYQQLSKSTAQ
jgi:hypothetical protein